MASGKRQRQEKSADQLDNEDFVVAQTMKLKAFQEELDVCLAKRKTVGAEPKPHESDSDSDQAHEDDDDVEDHPDVLAQYHKDTNAASRSATSRRCKVDVSNQISGKRVRVPTKAAPAAVATQRSARAMDEDVVYRAFCVMRMSLRKRWQKTPEEVVTLTAS